MSCSCTICLCSRLLFYSKCTGFTVCLTYTDISLTMYINQSATQADCVGVSRSVKVTLYIIFMEVLTFKLQSCLSASLYVNCRWSLRTLILEDIFTSLSSNSQRYIVFPVGDEHWSLNTQAQVVNNDETQSRQWFKSSGIWHRPHARVRFGSSMSSLLGAFD